MSLFLSKTDLQELTGRKVRSAQIRWLRHNGLRYTVTAEGEPRVLRSHLEALLGGSTARPAVRSTQPNADALREFLNRG